MSYSGYVMLLCERGHYVSQDCYAYMNPRTWKCHCGSSLIWWHSVDLTNGSYETFLTLKQNKLLEEKKIQYIEDGNGNKNYNIWVDDDGYWYGYTENSEKVKLFKAKRIDGYIKLKIDKKASFCKCSKCGHKHSHTEATYKIPQKGGHLVEKDIKTIKPTEIPSHGSFRK